MPSDRDPETIDEIIERVTVDAYDVEPGHPQLLLAAYRRWLGLDG